MEDTKTTPVMYDHCVAIYQKMVAEADTNEENDLVYTGHLTKLFASLGFPSPYYTSIMNHLKAMGCVEHLRRGGGNAHSVWKMVTPPTEESFESMVTMLRPQRGRLNQLEQQLRDLSRRVDKLESVR